MGNWPRTSHFAVGFALLALLSVLARGSGTNLSPLTNDEAFSWRLARCPWRELVSRTAADTHPPAHYLLLRGWVRALGDGRFSLRGLSMLLGAGAVAVTYLTVRESLLLRKENTSIVVDRWASLGPWLAALLVVESPLQAECSGNARMYSAAVFLASLSSLLLLRALRVGKRAFPWWHAYGASLAALCYTHNFGMVAAAAQAAFLAVWYAYRNRAGPKANRAMRGIAGAAVVFLTLYGPWIPVALAQARSVARGFWIPDIGPWEQLRLFVDLALPVPSRSDGLVWVQAAAVLALAGLLARRAGVVALLFLFQAAAPWLCCLLVHAAANQPILQDRYLAVGQVGWFAFCGLGVASTKRPSTMFANAAIVLWMLVCGSLGPPSTGRAREATCLAMDRLASELRAGDRVLVVCPGAVNQVRYELHRRGLDNVDVRCRLDPFAMAGVQSHVAALTVDDVLWPEDEVAKGCERLWTASDGDFPLGNGCQKLVRESQSWSFGADGKQRYVLTLYERAEQSN